MGLYRSHGFCHILLYKTMTQEKDFKKFCNILQSKHYGFFQQNALLKLLKNVSDIFCKCVRFEALVKHCFTYFVFILAPAITKFPL